MTSLVQAILLSRLQVIKMAVSKLVQATEVQYVWKVTKDEAGVISALSLKPKRMFNGDYGKGVRVRSVRRGEAPLAFQLISNKYLTSLKSF